MKYCITCFYPETKPDIEFDNNGVCSACVAFKNREKIDWNERKKEFTKIIKKIKNRSKGNYDCIIPVSGGKDSTWQVLKVLEHDLKILCVNARTCDLSPIGRRNLDNIKKLGVDMLEFAPNPKIRKKLNKIGLLEVGDISWPEHVGIFTIPINVASKFKISTIFWGENSQNEYGGPISKINNSQLNRSWLEEFGGLLGLRVSDLFDHFELMEQDLICYKYPSKKEIDDANIIGLFLGYYFPWDGLENAKIAKSNGFEFFHKDVEGSSTNYENLDNFQTGIHDYFKYIKYGFGRTTDIMCNLYRRNLVKRDEAIELIKKKDGNFPHTYLDKTLTEILNSIDVSYEEFIETCNKFTNKDIFKSNNKGEFIRDQNFNLIKKSDTLS